MSSVRDRLAAARTAAREDDSNNVRRPVHVISGQVKTQQQETAGATTAKGSDVRSRLKSARTAAQQEAAGAYTRPAGGMESSYLPSSPRSKNTAYERSGVTRDQYDSAVRSGYAARQQEETRNAMQIASLQKQLSQLQTRKGELEAGLDLNGAAELQPEIDSLKKQLDQARKSEQLRSRTTQERQLDRLREKKSELEAGLDLTGAAEIQSQIDSLNDELWQAAAEASGARKANLADLTLGSVKRGYLNSVYGQESYQEMMGRENQAEEYAGKLADEAYNFLPKGKLAQGISGAAELLGQQVRQWTDPDSLILGIGAAGAAGLAGQMGPQVLLPEETFTMPAAFLTGIQMGSAKSNFEIEAGLAYQEMLENGISPDTASKVASVVGLGNAALEMVQMDELVKSFQVLSKSRASDSILQAVGNELLERSLDVANETAQEVAQEGVTIAGTQIGSKLDKGEWAYGAEDVLSRLGDTALSSALSFGMMNVPGGAYNVYQQTGNKGTAKSGGPSVEYQSAPVAQNELLVQAAEQMAQNGTISGKMADRILADEGAVAYLQQAGVLDLSDGMKQTERRSAVKSSMERLASLTTDMERTEAYEDTQDQQDALTRAIGGGQRVDYDALTEEQIAAWNERHDDVWVDAEGKVYQMDPVQHISQRTADGVSSRAVNAFQFDHPELRPYYKQAASDLIKDASLSLDQPKTGHYERTTQGKRYVQNILESQPLRSAMDMGLTRGEIIHAAEALVADHGQENYAAAKRLEFVLDDMLTSGYTTVEGETFGPNEDYIQKVQSIPGYQVQEREDLPIWDMDDTSATEAQANTYGPATLTARARNDAELAYDIQQVQRAASALGENGSRALSTVYDVNMARYYDPKDVTESFFQVYNAALNGEKLTEEAERRASAMPEHLRLAAKSAAERDAVRAAQSKYFGDKAGLVRNANWKKAHLSSKTSRVLDALGKALGVEVRFAETVNDGQANAQYENGVITIALDAQDPVLTSLVHEIVHRVREASPGAYQTLADFVRQNMTEEGMDFNLAQRQELYQTTDADYLTEEMVADAFGRMLDREAVIRRFAQDHRSAAQKVMDALRDIVNAIKRVLGRQNLKLTKEQREAFRDLEKRVTAMERVFSDAVEASAKQANALQGKHGDGTMGATRNSLKEDLENGRARKEERGAFLQRAAGAGYAVYEGKTAAYGFRRAGQPNDGGISGETTRSAQTQQELTSLGISADVIDGPILRNQNGVTSVRAVNQSVTVDRSHIFISKNATLPPRNIAGHEAFHLWKNGVGRDAYIETVEDNLLFSSEAFLEYQSSIAETYLGGEADLANDEQMAKLREELLANISGDIHEGVNDEFMRPMFRDFDAVKAAWNDLVEQNSEKARYSIKEYTDEEKKQHIKDAVSYFGRTYKWAETGYITTDGKRLDFSGRHEGGPGGYRTVDHRDIRDALDEDYGGEDYSGSMVQFMSEGNIRIMPESGGINLSVMPTKAQMDVLSDFISKQRGEVILDLDTPDGNTVSSTEYPRGTHSSRVLSDIKAYFEDGTKPYVSDVARFRYSLKTDSQGRTLTEQQREYFKDSKAVDDQGRLMVMYHGTRKGGFTVFRDWSYLTANRKYAERYMDRDTGETMYEVYANIKKPFDTRIEECRAIWENEFYGEYSRTSLQESGLPDWTDGYDLVDFLEENGYDYDAILLDEGADHVNGSIVERGISYVIRSSEQIKSITNEKPTSDPDIRYSIKRTSNMTLAQQLKMFYDGKMASSDAFYFGETPDTLAVAGLDPLPLAFTQADFKKSTKSKHNVHRRVLKNLNKDLETALLSFGDGDRMGILTGDIDGDGKPLLVSIQSGVQMDADMVNAIRSAYGLDNPVAWLKNQIDAGKTFTLLDEKRANTFLYPYGYLASRKEGIRSMDGTVTQNEAESKSDFSLKDREQLAEYVKKYGAIPKGETPSREIVLPKKTAGGKNLSQTVRTILEAGATPDEMVPTIEKLAAKGDFSYDTYTDKQAISDAESGIKRVGWAQAISDWTDSMKRGEVSKANTAMGWALYNNAANKGDTETAITILEKMVEHQRSAAQALQATRILKKLSPETQLYGVQRSVANLQEELNKQYGEKGGPELKVDQELAERFLQAKDQEARDEALKDIYRDIGRQMPSRFRDKWNAWRYLAMLGNPRTHVRNVVGNAGFAPVVVAKDLTATAIEAAVYRVSGGKLKRSKGAVGFGKQDRALLSAAWGDYAKVQEAVLNGGKYSDFANANKYVEEGRVIFRSKALEKARKANSAALDAEDVWFSKPHYAYAMAQYCKAHNITPEQIATGKGLKQARAYAVLEAQKATYRDTNALSQTISEIGRSIRPGKNPVRKSVSLVMEGILPFRKTPANILARGLEYSPIGLINGIKQAVLDVQKGKKTGAEAIDSISAGLTGTGLLALGAWLAAQGLVRGHGGGDEKENELEELMGHQAYALELPNGTSVTLDWLAPEALPFFVGVNLWEQTGGEQEDVTLSSILSAVSTVSEPMLEMSCLQSLNDVFDAVGYASSEGFDGLPAALASAATSYLTQGLPTILGQAERTGEYKRYTTYTEKNAFLTGDMQYTLGRASARVPGWDYQQIPYIDAWGRVEQSGNTGARAFNNFLNPAYTSTINESEMETELLRLYEATGDGGVLPSRARKYFTVDKERKDLTAEEYVQYAMLKGQTSYELVTELTQSVEYQSMSDEEKVKAVKDAYDLANQSAKEAVSDYEPDAWIGKAAEAEKKYGISQETYITLKTNAAGIQSLKDADGETISNSKGLQIMEMVYNTPGLTDKQRKAMFEYLGVGKSVQHLNKAAVKEKLENMRKQAK